MATRDSFIDIPFLTSPDGYEGKLASIGLSIYDADETEADGLVPNTGSLSLVGQQVTVEQTNLALVVLFDIWSAIVSPLYVEFDITAVPFVVNPLVVEFDVIVHDGTPLVVTFDIFVEALLRARLNPLYSDIQGPVAEVDLS